jgi:hypothetical protein
VPKQRRDNIETAELNNRGTPTLPRRRRTASSAGMSARKIKVIE